MPRRDLVLSPDHAVYLDGVLIPVSTLVNGITIRREEVAHITYFHVELATHDVLTAEGLPAESYLDSGNRAAFDNAGPVTLLHPSFAGPSREARLCAPLVAGGPAHAAVVARLADIAAMSLVSVA